MYMNRLARTYNKALTQPLQPHRMNQLKEAIMAEPVSSAGWLVTLHGCAITDMQFLELKIRTSHKHIRISCMTRQTERPEKVTRGGKWEPLKIP
jgi:hypothetical protein